MSYEYEEDPSMIAAGYGGREFASRGIALGLGEMIVKELCCDQYAKSQLPLRVSDGGDRWILEGNGTPEQHPSDPEGYIRPKINMEIRKRNCQVTKFTGSLD